jgi:hypothetical protein
MRSYLPMTVLLVGIGIGGSALVSAQTAPAPKSTKPPAAHVHGGEGDASTPTCPMMGGGMGMMGGGMAMMGGGIGPMGMAGPGTKVDVKKIDKGVTITITATDPAQVTRVQKMAEAMRLMHEANTQ